MTTEQALGTSAADRRTVLFVSIGPYLGGAQKSLLTLLRALPDRVQPVLAAPADGPLVERVHQSTRVEEHVAIPNREEAGRVRATVGSALPLARWLIRNRRHLRAVHANGEAELKLLLPVLALIRAPVVVWHHSKTTSRSTIRFAPLWRRLRRRVTWAAVSESSRDELVAAGIARSGDVVVVPNPIDPLEVVPRAPSARDEDRLTVGYLGFEEPSKGLLLLPDIAEALVGAGIRLVVVTKERPRASNPAAVNAALDRLHALGPAVTFRPRDHDVRNIYADLDVLVVPSLAESFCRVAAEAMLCGLPIVASDLPALRELLGDDEAGLLFPVGDTTAAADAIRRLAADPTFRDRLGEAGRRRAALFTPAGVTKLLLDLYERGSARDQSDAT